MVAPPLPSFSTVLAFLFFSSLGLYHPRLCRKEWRLERRLKVARGWGRKEAGPETGMLSWSRNTVRVTQCTLMAQDNSAWNKIIHEFSSYWTTLYRTIAPHILWKWLYSREPKAYPPTSICSRGHKVDYTNHCMPLQIHIDSVVFYAYSTCSLTANSCWNK